MDCLFKGEHTGMRMSYLMEDWIERGQTPSHIYIHEVKINPAQQIRLISQSQSRSVLESDPRNAVTTLAQDLAVCSLRS